MARHRVTGRIQFPIACHPEVHVDGATIVEDKALVLRLLFDGGYSTPGERSDVCSGDPPSQGRMKKFDVRDPTSNRNAPQPPRCPFDLRKFGHNTPIR
jgi:hypothetical protein